MGCMEKSPVLLFFMLSLLFIASEEMVGVEGRMCESASSNFKGVCVGKSNCAIICKAEGFPHGHCKGFRRRCICSKPC